MGDGCNIGSGSVESALGIKRFEGVRRPGSTNDLLIWSMSTRADRDLLVLPDTNLMADHIWFGVLHRRNISAKIRFSL